jgi:hypothetical protein
MADNFRFFLQCLDGEEEAEEEEEEGGFSV